MKSGIKILGLALVAALSMMALTAAGAQAAAELRVAGKVLGAGEEAELSGTGGKGQLLVPGLGLTVECSEAKIGATAKNQESMAHGNVHILYHGCKNVGAACTIYPTEKDAINKTNEGLILATGLALARLLVINSVSRYFLVITPLVGQSFFATFVNAGAFCTLPEEVEVSGSTAVEVQNATTEATEHGIADLSDADEAAFITMQKEQKETPIGLFYGEEPSTIDGGNITNGKLVGKFAGQKFSLN